MRATICCSASAWCWPENTKWSTSSRAAGWRSCSRRSSWGCGGGGAPRARARGGMAVVFKAIELGLRRVVALKVLPPELGVTARAAERFKREARMVAEIDHPNIIPVYRVGQFGGILFVVMKFVEGKSLDELHHDEEN